MLLGFLVILWAIVIGSYVKDRASVRPGDSVSAFRDQLHTLQRTQPGGRRASHAPLVGPRLGQPRSLAGGTGSRPPAVSARLRQRRRDVLLTLAGAAAFTFLVALVVQSTLLIAINVLCDLALAAYVVALVQQQRMARERQVKVRYLPSQAAARPASRDRAAVLSRTAAN